MKVCVYGAGAVGGHVAGRLASVQSDVSLIARGEQLAAIRRDGLRVQTHEGTLVTYPHATEHPAELAPQDIVIVAVKAPSLPSIAEPVASLLHEESVVLFVANGIPWWYFASHGGELRDTRLERLDPGGTLWRKIGPERSVGAVAYTASTVIAPGIVHAENPRNRLIIGRPDGRPDARLDDLATLFDSSGLEVTVTEKIRDAVWTKLLMNLVGGALGVLTASPMADVLSQDAIARTADAMAHEGAAIANALGCDPGDPSEVLPKQAASHHLQSVAQDLIGGRTMEIDALFRVPLELGAMAEIPTPQLDLIIGLVTQRARAAGLYR